MPSPHEKVISVVRRNLSKAARAHVESQEALSAASEAVLQNAEPETGNPEEISADPVVATEEEWRQCYRVTGWSPSLLRRRIRSPFEVRLKVVRVGPSFYNGRRILCGEFREFALEFPFGDLEGLKNEIAKRYGGESWKIIIYDGQDKDLREINFRLADEPRNPEDNEAPADNPEDPGLIDGENIGEEIRQEVETDLRHEFRDIATMEKERTRIAHLRRARMEMERELSEAQNPNTRNQDSRLERMMERVIEAVSSRRGGEPDLMMATLQQQQQTMMDGLRLVVTSIGDKIAAQQSSQAQMFEIMSKMADARSASQAEITKVQMDAKKSEMDMIMKIFGDRREEKEASMDKMLELIEIGMKWKNGGKDPDDDGEDKPNDWLASAVSALTAMIKGQAQLPSNVPALPQQIAPPAEQLPPSPTPEELEIKRQAIEQATREAVAQIVERRRRQAQAALQARKIAAQRRIQEARASAPVRRPVAPPAAAEPQAPTLPAQPADADSAEGIADPMEGQIESEPVETPPEKAPVDPKQLMSAILRTVAKEMETLPAASDTVALAIKYAPPDWRLALIERNSLAQLAEFFRPYCEPELLDAVVEKFKANENCEGWLMTQGGTLRDAILREHQQQLAGQER